MRFFVHLAWSVVALLTVAAVLLPLTTQLPDPTTHALRIDHARYLSGTGGVETVTLPDTVFPAMEKPARIIRYEAEFQAPDNNEPLFIYIPTVNRRVSLMVNDRLLATFASSPQWIGPMISGPLRLLVPRQALHGPTDRLTVMLEVGEMPMPTYLSPIYIGSDAEIGTAFFIRDFVTVDMKIMAVAAQMILGIGLMFAYFFNLRTPLYSWLAGLLGASFVMSLELLLGWQPALQPYLGVAGALGPVVALLLVGSALTLADMTPPRWLSQAIMACVILLLPVAALQTRTSLAFLALFSSGSILAGSIIAVVIVARGALQRRNIDAQLMLPPIVLMAWFGLHDAFIAMTLPRHGFQILYPYSRLLFLVCLNAVLMRRMFASLKQLDQANETLAARLCEREAELNALYQRDRIKADHEAKTQERLRITQDLHDGISGHLASIVALSERTGEQAIEKAARQALNDLRLVIYSLDLGDRELPLALANFRDRLVPQLHHLGVTLDWSVAGLPEVSGLTPGSALVILRILQEAITNAVKHGPARRIAIRGANAEDAMVAITVENDGRPLVRTSGGYGMASMERRARQLGGRLIFENIPGGVRLSLLLPSDLPELDQTTVMQNASDDTVR